MTAAVLSIKPRRAAAALAAVAVGSAALLISLQSGAAASPGTPAVIGQAGAPVSTTAGKLSLAVDPAGGLTPAGATLKVTGSGFDTGTGIYVAICHADGKAPASLADCIGGAVPGGNTTKSWAHVSNKATGGGVVPWGNGGSFSVQLVLPASNSTSDALDCAKVACAVYTAPDQGSSTAENLSVPLVYAAPPTSSSTTASTSSSTTSSSPASSLASSSPPSSSTSPSAVSTSSAVVATTVEAKIVRSPSVVAGGMQQVLFAGFAKDEPVTVTLYSAPRSLPATRADQDGVVTVDFTVPADLEPGTHLLRVVGQNSKVTGIASFVVTAPVASSSAVSSSTSAPSSAASSSAPVSSAVPLPATSLSASPTAASTTAPSSAIAPVIGPAASPGKVVWPWYALGALLVILAGVVAYLLNRRFRLAVERRDNDAMLADAAAAEHERNLDAIARANADAPTTYLGGGAAGAPGVAPTPPAGGYSGYHPGEHGLLSGRDNPDNPALLSGTGYRALPPVDPPTTALPDERTTSLPGERTTVLPGGERTTSLPGTTQPPGQGIPPSGRPGGSTPANFDPAAGGPATGSWRPDFADDTAGGAPGGGGPATGSRRPAFGDDPDSGGAPGGPPAGPGVPPAGEPDSPPAGGRPGGPTGEEPDPPPPGGRHSRPS